MDSISEQAGAAADLKNARRRKDISMSDSTIDRLPPHSTEAERGVLGCCLISPNESIAEVIQKIGESSDAFYDLRHQEIFVELKTMFDARVPIDVVTVMQRLKDKGLLEKIGGIPYLSGLQDATPSAANLSYYLEYVVMKQTLRRLVNTATAIVGRVYDYEGEVDGLLDEVERDILAIRPKSSNEIVPAKELVNGAIQHIEDTFNRKGAIGGISTGFPDFDRMTDGLHKKEMIIIAGRPSTGKTSLACNIIEHVILDLKLPVGMFSLEMSREQLMLRMMCSVARVNLRSIREGFMAETDFPKLTSAGGKLHNAPIYIDDTGGLSIMQVRTRMRRMVQQFGIRLGVIDYLQLMNSNSKRGRDNRQQEISDISGGIKALTKELDIPILVLSQLNRLIEQGKSRKPRLSDLRESGSLEQDADLVGLLYRPDAGDEETVEEADGCPVNLLIAKQRNGPCGDINLTFLKSFTRFESAARISDEDVPTQ